jgi:hypothetical protein
VSVAKVLGCASATNIRPEDDFFETPDFCTLDLMAAERLPATIWEPCSGSGEIAKVLRAAGHNVIESDLNPRNGQAQTDMDHDEAPGFSPAGWAADELQLVCMGRLACAAFDHAHDIRSG